MFFCYTDISIGSYGWNKDVFLFIQESFSILIELRWNIFILNTKTIKKNVCILKLKVWHFLASIHFFRLIPAHLHIFFQSIRALVLKLIVVFVSRSCRWEVFKDRLTVPRQEGSWQVRLLRVLSSLTGLRCSQVHTGEKHFCSSAEICVRTGKLLKLGLHFPLPPQFHMAVLAGPPESCCPPEGELHQTFPSGGSQTLLQLWTGRRVCQLPPSPTTSSSSLINCRSQYWHL